MSRPPIRLFVSDIDGTLVRKDKSLGPPVIAAVRRLREAGVKFSLISARPVSGMTRIAAALGVEGPMGAFNGGTIAQPDGRVTSAAHLSPELARRALEQLDQDWITPWVFADGQWFATTLDNAHVPSERVSADQEPEIVADFSRLMERVDKIVGVSDELDRLRALDGEVARALGDGATVARSQVYYLDVTAPEANKGHGVTAIAKAFGVPLDQTAVIGDGQNDVRMFHVAGLSVAVRNAAPDVQAAADETAASNTEDGVADAIDRLVIPAARAEAARG